MQAHSSTGERGERGDGRGGAGPRGPSAGEPALRFFACAARGEGAFADALINFFRGKSAEGEPQISFAQLLTLAGELGRAFPGRKCEIESELVPRLFVEMRRFFEGIEVQRLYSLRVPELSMESIIWTVRSMEKLRLMPTDKNVCVRLKEIFGTEIDSGEWKKLMRLFATDPAALAVANRKAELFGALTVDRFEKGYVLGIRNVTWSFEDKQNIESDDADYLCFLEFIRSFLEVEGHASQITPESAQNNIVVWVALPLEDSVIVRRAITSGNFGFSNFVKILGPERLRRVSLGRVSALVRTALHNQVLVHHAKFIVLNPSTETQERNLREAQKLLLQLLRDRPEGIALSRLPSLFSKLMCKPFDCTALGFSKFKQFVASLGERITIHASSKNHAKVMLSDPNSALPPGPKLASEPAANRLLINLSRGKEYENRTRDLLHEVLARQPQNITLREIEGQFVKALGAPLDLSAVCTASLSGFVRQAMGQNAYLLGREPRKTRLLTPTGAPVKSQSIRTAATYTAAPEAGNLPFVSSSKLSLSLSGDASKSDSPNNEFLGEREFRRLHNLLNDEA